MSWFVKGMTEKQINELERINNRSVNGFSSIYNAVLERLLKEAVQEDNPFVFCAGIYQCIEAATSTIKHYDNDFVLSETAERMLVELMTKVFRNIIVYREVFDPEQYSTVESLCNISELKNRFIDEQREARQIVREYGEFYSFALKIHSAESLYLPYESDINTLKMHSLIEKNVEWELFIRDDIWKDFEHYYSFLNEPFSKKIRLWCADTILFGISKIKSEIQYSRDSNAHKWRCISKLLHTPVFYDYLLTQKHEKECCAFLGVSAGFGFKERNIKAFNSILQLLPESISKTQADAFLDGFNRAIAFFPFSEEHCLEASIRDYSYMLLEIEKIPAQICPEDFNELYEVCEKVRSINNYYNNLSYVEKLLSDYQKGDYWKSDDVLNRDFKWEFRYPDGKKGDMAMSIFSEYGSVIQKDPICYEGKISSDAIRSNIIIPIVFMHLVYYDSISNPDNINELAVFLHEEFKLQIAMDLFYKVPVVGVCKHPRYQIIKKKIQTISCDLTNIREDYYQQIVYSGNAAPKWKSEFQLYTLFKSLFPNAWFQYHAAWLGAQSLDIFLPDISTGIEYQGIQHYEPVEIFGGQEGFIYNRERDEKKRILCKENGVALLEWPYTRSVTEEEVRMFLKENGIVCNENSDNS